MSVDFPRAWQIARAVPPAEHPHPKCSFRQTGGGLLCDCEVLTEHPEYVEADVLHAGEADAVEWAAADPSDPARRVRTEYEARAAARRRPNARLFRRAVTYGAWEPVPEAGGES